MKKLDTDKALIFSASVLLIYTIICIVMIFMDKVPDSTLTASIFLSFGVAEGGYCAWIHNRGKNTKKEEDEDYGMDIE